MNQKLKQTHTFFQTTGQPAMNAYTIVQCGYDKKNNVDIKEQDHSQFYNSLMLMRDKLKSELEIPEEKTTEKNFVKTKRN